MFVSRQGLLAFAIMCAGIAPAAAQGTNGSESSGGLATALAACSAEGVMEQCPNACLVACQDPDFLEANVADCDAASVTGPGADGASCPSFDTVQISSLQACLDERRSIERQPSAVIQRSPERLEIFNNLFSGQPQCAASDLALVAMFECLDGESQVVQAEYDEIDAIDVPDGPPTAESLRELSCQVGDEDLVEIDVSASALRSRADELSDVLGGVTSCRREYSDWLLNKGDACAGADFVGCEAVVEVFQQDLEASLGEAADQNQAVATVIEDLTRDIDILLALSLVAPSAQCAADE